MGRTLFEKVWDAHVVKELPDGQTLLYIDLHLVHEVTSPQAFAGLRFAGRKVRRPELTFATMDHNVPTVNPKDVRDAIARKQIETLEQNCREFGVQLAGLDSPFQGIVHVIGPELGLTMPGKTIVCGTAIRRRTARSARSPLASARARWNTCSPRSASGRADRRPCAFS